MYIPRRHTQYESVELDDSPDIDKRELEDIERDQESSSFLRRDSNVGRIETAAREYTLKAMKLILSENVTCIDREILIQIARVQQKRNYGLLSLPFSIMFFLLFAVSAFQHEDVTNVYTMEQGLRLALGKGAADIRSLEGAYHWLNSTLFPTFFQQTDLQGNEIADKSMWSRILTYNTLEGPLYIEQERSTKALCEDGAGIATDMLCYNDKTTDPSPFGRDVNFPIRPPQDGEYAAANVTTAEREEYFTSLFKATGGRRLRVMRPGYAGRLPGGSMSQAVGREGNFRAFFYSNTRYSLIQERLNYMYEKGWMDKQTKSVTIRALLLNAEVGRPRLESFKLVLSFSRAGEVFTKLVLDTIFLEFWHSTVSMGADAMWIMMLMGVTIFEFRNIFSRWREGALRKHVQTPWFVLQWAIICIGWGIVFGYAYTNMLLGGVKVDLSEVIKSQKEDIPPERNTIGEDLIMSSSWLSFVSAWLRLFVAQYHLLLMIRFFVAFRAQPRLGVVVSTLEICLLDILHFMVILIPTYAAYAISGVFIFGRRLEEFSNVQAAMGVCFKILTETEYDWPHLTEEHYWTTALWTWSFMLFLAMLMLNMVLAIVLDAYSEQRKLAGKSESIYETFKSIIVVLMNWKRWVNNDKLLEKFHTMPRLVSREEFLKEFPGMLDKQAQNLIQAAQMQAANVHAGPEHMKHTMRMAMAMKVAMDKVSDDIAELDEGSYLPPEDDETMKNARPSWLTELSKELASQNHCMLMLQWQLQQLNWAWQALDTAHGKGATFDLSKAATTQPSGEIL